jgi:predicted RNA-binding Zn ribbon-like protein
MCGVYRYGHAERGTSLTVSDRMEHSTPANASQFACIDFINSSFADHRGGVEQIDRLPTPEWQDWFLDRYGLAPTMAGSAPVEQLVTLRRRIRRILEKWARGDALGTRDVRALDECVTQAPMIRRLAMTPAGLELRDEPLRRDWTWTMASVTASAVHLLNTGDPHRLKTCANPNCTWMFYDDTNNHSKQFCSTTPCGVLMRVRRFREG